MKKITPLTLCLCLLFIGSNEAQILGRLQDRINKTVEDKIVDKIGDEIDKTLQGEQDTLNKSSQKITIEVDEENEGVNEIDVFSMMSALQDDVDPSEVYNFTMNITMKTSSGDSQEEMKILVDEKAGHVGMMSEEESLMIIDKSINRMVVLNTEDNSYMILPDFSQFVKNEDDEDHEVSIEKTGKRKTILGYPCEEYIVKDESYETHAWMTSKLDINFASLFSNSDGGSPMSWVNHQYAELKELFPLSSSGKNLSNGVTYHMDVTDIDATTKTIRMKDMTRMDMNMNDLNDE